MHTEKPIFTAQFHPEAFGGPTDTEVSLYGVGVGIFGDSLCGNVPAPYHILELLFFFYKNSAYYKNVSVKIVTKMIFTSIYVRFLKFLI